MGSRKQANYTRIGSHLLFWLAYILYQAVNDGWKNKDEFSFILPSQFLTDVPVAIFLAYVNLYVLMPAFYYNRSYLKYIPLLLILLMAGGLMERYFTYRIWIPLDKFNDPLAWQTENREFWIPVRILRNAAEIFPVIAATTLAKLMRNSYQHERALREIERGKFNAEMNLLKAQINPHFFFNTLNSLYALTLAGSNKASGMVLRLSELMRYMLYEASGNKVLLKSEITHLENYISIEQMRFADRLDLSFRYSGDIEGKSIAPLLLLPFIENAFKHGIGDNAGWVTIDLKVTGCRLFLNVENSYNHNPVKPPQTTGLGLNNVKRRLKLIYPSQYELGINNSDGIFVIELKLNL
jgi:two-component system LytT family sensor kinase